MITTNQRVLIILILIFILIIFIFRDQCLIFATKSFNYKNFEKQLINIQSDAYVTFDKSQSIKPNNMFYPNNLQEVKNIIKNNPDRKIRVSGSSHTFNGLSLSPDIIIRTNNLKKILKTNKKQLHVTVESGIILEELNTYLGQNGMSLHVQPSIQYQSIAGALATSTHGSNWKSGSMSDAILDITVVHSNGTIKTYTKNDTEFKALTCNLGCLGFIYSITLLCMPLFVVNHSREVMSLQLFLKNLNFYKNKYQYLQAYIDPLQNEKTNCIVYLREKIIPPNNKKYKHNCNQTDIKKVTKCSDVSHRVLTNNEETGFYTKMEVGIPITNLVTVLKIIMSQLHEFTTKHKYTTSYPILLRFTGKDRHSLLSMTHDRRETAFLSIFNDGNRHNDPILNKYFKEFEDILVYKFGGRVHHGKKNFLTYSKMKHIYGPKLTEFIRIQKHMDPKGMFLNKYLYQLLTPPIAIKQTIKRKQNKHQIQENYNNSQPTYKPLPKSDISTDYQLYNIQNYNLL
jgi:FAD/FMN-containing dehydrogenase